MLSTIEVGALILLATVALGGSIAAYLIHLTLRQYFKNFSAENDRQKKAMSVRLILQWNQNVFSHRRAIEKGHPGLIDKRNDGAVVELTRAQAKKIYEAQPDTDEAELRFHMIELLNFFEAVALASEYGVADSVLLERAFRGTLRNYYQALVNFMDVVAEARGYKPWDPYVLLIRRWEPELPLRTSMFK